MKALVCDSYGSLDEVRYREVADPAPDPDAVLVQVKAAGAVFTDILFAEGKYQVKPPLPFVLGSELAGEVIAVGARVTRLKPGDRIMSLAINFGAFAERVVLPAWLPSLLPENLSFETGAAVIVVHGYGPACLTSACCAEGRRNPGRHRRCGRHR